MKPVVNISLLGREYNVIMNIGSGVLEIEIRMVDELTSCKLVGRFIAYEFKVLVTWIAYHWSFLSLFSINFEF